MNEAANDPDRLPESPSFQVQQQCDRNENMSVGMPPSGDDALAVNGGVLTSVAPIANQNGPFAEQVNSVINSEASLSWLR
jgi:hypothetical protein